MFWFVVISWCHKQIMFSDVSRVGFDYWNFCIGEAKGWTWGSVEEGTLSWDLCGRFYFLLVFSCQLFCESQTCFLVLICFQYFMMNRSIFHWMLLLVDSSRRGKRGTNFMKQTTRWSLVYTRRWVHFADFSVFFWLNILFQFWSCCIWWDRSLLSVLNILTSLIFCFLHQLRRMTFQNLLTHVTWRPV